MSVVKGERRAMKLQKTLAECFDCFNMISENTYHKMVCYHCKKRKEKERSNCYKENYFSKKCFDCDNKMICRDKVYDDLLKQFEEKEKK